MTLPALRHITSDDVETFFATVNPHRLYHQFGMGDHHTQHYLGSIAVGFLLGRGVDPQSNPEAVRQMGFGNQANALEALL